MESTGAGHRRAAQALEAVLRRTDPTLDIQLINLADHMNETLHHAYQKLRVWLMEDAPHVFGQLYKWADRPHPEVESLFDRAMLELEKSSLHSLLRFMTREHCDLAIHTHFFAAEMAAHLRRKKAVSFPHVTVTTDFFSHALWARTPCELFAVASRDAALYLTALGVEPELIMESGIPVDPGFREARRTPEDYRRETELRTEGLRTGGRRPRILLMTTGTAAEISAQNLMHLLEAQSPLDVTVLAGDNEERLSALHAVPAVDRHRVFISGRRDDMPRLLEDSDLCIGKAGGLTCSEALAVGTPMGLLSPRPDQEAQNADFLLERQAATRIFRSSLLGPKMDELFGDLRRWSTLRAASYGLGRPEAADAVVERALALLPRHAAEHSS